MPKITIISDKTQTVKQQTIKLKVGRFVVTEFYTDNDLISQEWSVYGGFRTTHPTAYEPTHIFFHYYDDISFLDSEDCVNSHNFYQQIPEPSLIKNWSTFKGCNHVLCIYLNMDGCIYRIDKPDPIPMWRRHDYICSFRNHAYNLSTVKQTLNNYQWIRNIQIVNIPSYNQDDGSTKGLEFEYKLPSKKHLKTKLQNVFPGHYFGY